MFLNNLLLYFALICQWADMGKKKQYTEMYCFETMPFDSQRSLSIYSSNEILSWSKNAVLEPARVFILWKA